MLPACSVPHTHSSKATITNVNSLSTDATGTDSLPVKQLVNTPQKILSWHCQLFLMRLLQRDIVTICMGSCRFSVSKNSYTKSMQGSHRNRSSQKPLPRCPLICNMCLSNHCPCPLSSHLDISQVCIYPRVDPTVPTNLQPQQEVSNGRRLTTIHHCRSIVKGWHLYSTFYTLQTV